VAKAMLDAKGATVVMTRATMDMLGLPQRRTISRRPDADAFVSIRLNAYRTSGRWRSKAIIWP
jgi:N-acetylmuramoyl-L-alanine amidase